MKAVVNRDGCIACELCVETCPEVFRMGEDGPAEAYVDEIPEEVEDAAKDAAEACPVDVIEIHE